ncbi:MAG: SGNH/GDSL hydrolase family protein [Actinomycetota bacterium]
MSGRTSAVLGARAFEVAVGVAVAVALVACSGGGGTARVTATPSPAPDGPGGETALYVAVGASETTGAGTEVPLREAWPQVLFRTAMSPATVFVNMGLPGATVARALAVVVPTAASQQPDIATVWLNVNDVVAGVEAADFERDLGRVVSALRRNGATRVLVANTPPIDHLPSYLACRPDPPPAAPPCRAAAGEMPPPEVVNQVVADCNAATARVAQREGAELVDLHTVGLRAREAGIADALVSADGFHPNAGGHQAVANAFAEVLARPPAPPR